MINLLWGEKSIIGHNDFQIRSVTQGCERLEPGFQKLAWSRIHLYSKDGLNYRWPKSSVVDIPILALRAFPDSALTKHCWLAWDWVSLLNVRAIMNSITRYSTLSLWMPCGEILLLLLTRSSSMFYSSACWSMVSTWCLMNLLEAFKLLWLDNNYKNSPHEPMLSA